MAKQPTFDELVSTAFTWTKYAYGDYLMRADGVGNDDDFDNKPINFEVAAATYNAESTLPVDPHADNHNIIFDLAFEKFCADPPPEEYLFALENQLFAPDADLSEEERRWSREFSASERIDPVEPPTTYREAQLERLEHLKENERQIHRLHARRATIVNDMRECAEAHTGTNLAHEAKPKAKSATGWSAESITLAELQQEVSFALKVSDRVAGDIIHTSWMLEDLPETLASLGDGDISYGHAAAIVGHADSLPKAARGDFDAKVAPHARTTTATRLNAYARKLREKMNPESIKERHVKAVADRCLTLQPARDGMAYLTAFIPAVEATAIFNRHTMTAKAMKRPEETRTQAQLVADSFMDLEINGDHSTADPDSQFPRGIVPTVLVTVPAFTLLGRTEEPGELEGYGPIDPDTAREIAGKAKSFIRLLTHPETGTVMSVGQDRYKVPADMRMYLRIRDEVCRAWGCGRLAVHCEIDHTLDWQFGGHTKVENLSFLCAAHHTQKGLTSLSVKQLGDGVLEWTTRLGQKQITYPAVTIGGVNLKEILPTAGGPPGDQSADVESVGGQSKGDESTGDELKGDESTNDQLPF